ncbi:MAG: hypothetical protein CL761_01735 [Chloroflexi bacterium]|nr:hypothetical protein [Chloroflexota bacterium]
MPAVTQRVDNYLGGVSRQSDDKKLPGQVEECLNGYPDPTFGLTKRPGFQWIANLGTGTTYDNSKWFYISRTEGERYIGCITPVPSGQSQGAIAIWNAVTGASASITYGTGAQAYLTGTRTDYDVLTVQDVSIITNKTKTAAVTAAPSFTANSQGTIKLIGDANNIPYSITVAGQTTTFTSGGSDDYTAVLTTMESNINAFNISGLIVTRLSDSLHLSRNATFTLTGSGGANANKLGIFQDQIATLAELPNESKDGHVVKILNSGATTSSFFMKYTADNGTSGPGFWSEGIAPNVSTGLDNTTMPHELINTGTNAFTFQRVTWVTRNVGDDTTNAHPSFIGKQIQQSFFHNNRLGFLSSDNVSMSQSKEFFNFYHTSAQTVTDADPIDLRASTIRPAALHSIIPTTQGLILFSANQQFLMAASDGILTPSKASIRAIANYEMDTVIDPVDMGTTINFISKTPSYTRIFGMVTRGENENPVVLDIGRVVNEWVPATVDTLIASPQNQFIAMSGQSSRYIYFFRTYNDGEKNLVQAWFNWETMGNVQAMAADSDDFYAVTKQGSQFTLSKASLSQSPQDAIIVNNEGKKINPCIDLYATASSVTYDTAGEFSKCFIPYTDATDLTPVLIIKGTTAQGNFIESGFTMTPERVVESGNTYFKVPFKNLTSIASDVIVGYKFDFDIILPKTYFKIDDALTKSDFSANLTVARMKFAVGLSGVMGFKLKSKGIRQGKKEYTGDGSTTVFTWDPSNISYIDSNQIKVKINNVVTTAFTVNSNTQLTMNAAPANGATVLIYTDEWYNLNPVITADQYLANDIPLADQTVFTLPIHQKTENFTLRLFNDTPFPVALNSMMWEGIYSPRFYKRT